MEKSLKQNRWKGLIRKEWAQQKWSVIGITFIILIITVVDFSSLLVGDSNESWFRLSTSRNTWFLLHMFMGVVLFLTSLENDTKNPDIWLHSTASMAQLVGAKIVFVTLAVISSLLLSGTSMNISTFILGTAQIEMFLFLVAIVLFSLNAMYLMVIVFFIWSIHRVLHSRIGRYSFLITGILVFVSTIGWAVIWFTDGFQKVKEMGPLVKLDASTNGLTYLHETSFIVAGLMPERALITIGSLCLYIVFSSGLLIAGAKLFEKKVRL